MLCPHCQIAIHREPHNATTGAMCEYKFSQYPEIHLYWYVSWQICPECRNLIVWLKRIRQERSLDAVLEEPDEVERIVEPKLIIKKPPPKEVPSEYADDYREACLVLDLSPKASAALSRRCLQNIIRDKARIKKGTLFAEIEEMEKSPNVPPYIKGQLHTIREIGNMAAHPTKNQATGEIIDVEPEEAEWNIEVLDTLFDFYFVGPEKEKQKKAALNKKLKDAGKNPL